MLERLKKIIEIWRKIKETFWLIYFSIFNVLYFAVLLSPIVLGSIGLLILTPHRPYILYLFLGVVAVVILLAPIVRFLIVRARLRTKLRRVCAQSGFTLKLRRSFFVSRRRASGKVDLTVATPKTLFEVTFLPSSTRFSALEFSTNIDAYRRVSRIGFSPRKQVTRRGQTVRSNEIKKSGGLLKKFHSLEIDNSDMKQKSNLVSRRIRRVILLSPVPGEVRHLDEYGSYREIENGDGVGNFVIYSGSGFVNMLDRLCRDPE